MEDGIITRPRLALTLIVTATVLGIMGTDLVLPAVPTLPEGLGGTAGQAQLVLAAYLGGTSLGLLAYGALGDRLPTRWLFIASLVLTGVVSFACALATSMWMLIVLRVIQGAVASGPAVFAPAIVRSMFDEARGIRAIGALGSIESLAPALAPILGVWLLAFGGWTLSFKLMGAVALVLAGLNIALPLIPQTSRRAAGSYARLIADSVYLRYALSQALALGGLLVFVFGTPAVMVHGLGGDLTDFIVMQVCGIATFILAANSASRLVRRFGAEPMIAFGTLLAASSIFAILGYALAGGVHPLVVTALFVPINIGLGLRGPPGFYRAVLASHGDDARGSALVILFVMLATAGGTAAVAPFIQLGLVPLAASAALLQAAAVASLFLPRLVDQPARA